MRDWFEQHNLTAQAQVLERMAEAIRKGYWDAPERTRRALVERWQELAQQLEEETGAPLTRQFIADMAQGFGLSGASTDARSEEHTSELQSLMRNSYAVFC